ncbi:hypothetical protein RFI_27358 [Reticulomyxa filosa]|uniref:Transmembrane protein n=1 Tax=Reticulomyxa filosa TaxID=46433 RepID=X6M7Y1_RETFI|nr:hypothetical protein RFI_27358 [Reticulomyxa filosa]|eukprot:ETO10019.1 hypothetical protein RFI_27358 [Reticulomyxa filosa]
MPSQSSARLLTYLYDGYTIAVSVADVITDVMVMVEYYRSGETVFFWVGMANLIIAQLCYCFAFVLRYGDNRGCLRRLLIFTCVLPLAPLLSFAFYWASLPNNRLSKLFEKFGLSTREYTPYTNKKKKKTTTSNQEEEEEEADLKEWVRERIHKNMGFLLEATVEAFPQCLIQMSAIVYTSRVNWVTLLSIFLSLISFATKSVVFSQSVTVSIFIFNWLSMICDFLGIFVVVAWVFFKPDNSSVTHTFVGDFSVMGQAWFLKVLIFSIPLIFYCGIPLSGVLVGEFYSEIALEKRKTMPCYKKFPLFCFYFVIAIIIFICGSTVTLFVIEIPFFSGIAFFLYIMTHDRYSNQEREFWQGALKFVQQSPMSNRYCTFLHLMFTSCICSRRCSMSYSCCGPLPKMLTAHDDHSRFNAKHNYAKAFELPKERYPTLPHRDNLSIDCPEFFMDSPTCSALLNRRFHDTVVRIAIVNWCVSGRRVAQDYKFHEFLCDSFLDGDGISKSPNTVHVAMSRYEQKERMLEETEEKEKKEQENEKRESNKVISWENLTFAHLRYFSQQFHQSTFFSLFKVMYFAPSVSTKRDLESLISSGTSPENLRAIEKKK